MAPANSVEIRVANGVYYPTEGVDPPDNSGSVANVEVTCTDRADELFNDQFEVLEIL